MNKKDIALALIVAGTIVSAVDIAQLGIDLPSDALAAALIGSGLYIQGEKP